MQASRRTFLARTLRSSAAAGMLAVFGGPLSAVAARSDQKKISVQDFHDERPPSGSFASSPRALPAGTTHVGIHWRGEGRKPARVSARISGDGRNWSEWVELSIDDDPFGDDETFAALLDARGASQVQYRVSLPGGRRLDRVTVTAIGTDPPVAASVLAGTAFAAGPSWSFTTVDGAARSVYTREDWGCDELLGLKADGTRIWPAMFVPNKKLIVHHTATSNRYTDGAAEVRAIFAYHARTKGWGDIGYNALVDRFGNVFEGRRGREGNPREKLSGGVVAGHCYRHNYGSTGVAVLGDFTKRKLDPNNATDKAMLKALEDVAVYECGRAGLAADALSDFLKSDDTWHNSLPTITGHKDSEATACPGTPLYSYATGTLRTNAAARLRPFATPKVSLVGPAAREATASSSLLFSWESAAAGCEYRLEGWRKINADDIEYWNGAAWSGVEPTGWTSAPASGQRTYTSLQPGHYTFHVRGYGASGARAAVESSFTVLVR